MASHLFKCWLIKTVKTDWSLELIWLIFFSDEGQGVSSLSKHLEFKNKLPRGAFRSRFITGRGRIEWYFQIELEPPWNISKKNASPLVISLSSQQQWNFAAARLALYFLKSVFDVHCSSMGFSNSLKPYNCMKRIWSVRRHGVVEEPADLRNPADLGLKPHLTSHLKQTINLPLPPVCQW